MTAPASKFTLGLVQMACTNDPAENLALATARIEEAAREGAQIVCLQELFLAPYFCQSEDPAHFDLAEPVPGPTTEALGKLAKSLEVVIVAPLFERRAPGVYHNTRRGAGRRRAHSSGTTARCTSPTIRSTTRSSTSRRAIWASAASTRAWRASACSSAGTSGIPRRRG